MSRSVSLRALPVVLCVSKYKNASSKSSVFTNVNLTFSFICSTRPSLSFISANSIFKSSKFLFKALCDKIFSLLSKKGTSLSPKAFKIMASVVIRCCPSTILMASASTCNIMCPNKISSELPFLNDFLILESRPKARSSLHTYGRW